MQNPYLKKRGDSPPPRNSVKRELDQNTRERMKKGLAKEMTPRDSDDDGIEDDNELLGDFNATLRPKGSGFLSHNDSLMMTMKKPWQPPSSRWNSSPPLSNSKGRKLGSMGEEDEDLIGDDSDEEPKKTRPSFLRNQPSNERTHQRPKSPSIHGRKKSLEDLDEVDYILNHSSKKTSLQKRSVKSSAGDAASEDRKSSGQSTPKLPKSPLSRKSSDEDLSQKSSRFTPTESRKSPFDGRKTPSDDSRSAKLFGDYRKTLTEVHKSPKDYGEKSRISPNERFSPRRQIDESHTMLSDGYKSPRALDSASKSPKVHEEIRRTPENNKKSPKGHQLKKKSSVLDFLEESGSAKQLSDDDESRKSKSEKRKNSSTPDLVSVRVATTSPKITKQQSLENVAEKHLSDDESSVCEDKLEEPIRMAVTDASSNDKNKPKVKMVKIQRTVNKEVDETIERVGEAQNGTQNMRYIDPVKNDDFKTNKANKSRPVSGKIFKPKPIHASTGTLSRTSGSSNEALNYDSTKDIRQAVYEVWKVQATDKLKQAAKERKQKQREVEEKQRKEKEEKALESKATYEAWKDKKKGFVSTKVVEAKKEQEKKKQEEEKKKEKQKESQDVFIKWKENKDIILKEKHREKVRSQKREDRVKKEKKADKEENAQTAFKKWSQHKEEFLKSKKEEEVKRQRQQEEQEKQERLEQQQTARDQYEKWLEKKERQEIEAKQRRQQDSDEEDYRRPWRPSSTKIHHIR